MINMIYKVGYFLSTALQNKKGEPVVVIINKIHKVIDIQAKNFLCLFNTNQSVVQLWHK